MKRTLWTASFLTLTFAAIGMELWGALDNSPDTTTWTELIARFVPVAVTTAAIGWLVHWLPGHFQHAYSTYPTEGGGTVGRYAKFIVAAVGAAAVTAVPLWMTHGHLTGPDVAAAITAAAAAVGVYLVPNTPAPDPNTPRILPGPPKS